jgi:hypothetical protein
MPGSIESGLPVRLTGKDLARLVDDAGDRLREATPALDAKGSGHRGCRRARRLSATAVSRTAAL